MVKYDKKELRERRPLNFIAIAIAIAFIIVSNNAIDATILLSLVTTLLTLIITLMQFLRQFDTNVIELN